MRRSLSARLFAGLVAVWFTINMVEPRWLHACPVHDGFVAGGGPADTAHHAHGSHDPTEHHGGSPGKTHLCQCLGACCVAILAATPTPTDMAAAEVSAQSSGIPDYEYLAVARAHQRPFANGPPPG